MKIVFLLVPLLALTCSQAIAAMRADLDAWMHDPGDRQTVCGSPLRSGESVTSLAPGIGRAKAKSPVAAEQQ